MIKSMFVKDGKVSSKRVITFMSFTMLLIALGMDIFTDVTIDPMLIKSFTNIVEFGLGFTASEYIIKGVSKQKEDI
jgi:hypothetical protein